MFKFYRLFAFILAFFSIYNAANAQHVGTIDDFSILPAYLDSDGKVIVSSGSTTEIKFSVKFIRQYTQTYPIFVWKPFNMTVFLSTPVNNNPTIIGAESKITNDNFETNNTILTKVFTVTVNNSALNTNNPIYLGFKLNDANFPINSYNNKSYYPSVPTSPGTTNPGTTNPGTTNPGTTNPGTVVFPINDPTLVKPNRTYQSGTTVATNGTYHLEFQSDGNLVLYKNGYYVLWAADVYAPGGTLQFTTDGVVKIFNSNGSLNRALAPYGDASNLNCYWVLQGDGNFVGYQSYRIQTDGTVNSYGNVLGATHTPNGIRSNRYGRLQERR